MTKWPYWWPQAADGSVQQLWDADGGSLSDPSAANWTGFLRPILDAVCEAAALDCELVFYTELTDRIPLLQNVRRQGSSSFWRTRHVVWAVRSAHLRSSVTKHAPSRPSCPLSLCNRPCHGCVQGSVDFIVDTLSATNERAQLVDFVHPGFYSAGGSGRWERLLPIS